MYSNHDSRRDAGAPSSGAVINILVQPKRDHFAVIRFFLLQVSRCRPRVIITNKLRSYGVAKKVVLPQVAHRRADT